MTHTCCASCRVRFPRSAHDRAPCPLCGAETTALEPESALGFQRYRVEAPQTLVAAVAIRVPRDGSVT